MQLLLVDDDLSLVNALTRALAPEFTVEAATTEIEAGNKLERGAYDLLIVDEKLPQGSGLGVIRSARLRYPQMPIVVITSQASKELAITCLNLGVNRFLEKPFDIAQLRLELTMLRPAPLPFSINEEWVYRPDRRRIEFRGEAAKLTPIEFRIVEFLIGQRGRCVSRQELVKGVWGEARVSTHTLDTHLSSLRRKAQPIGERIKVSRGRGYWWES